MIPLLYEDKDLLVCLKSPGLLSQDGPEGDLPTLLRAQCRCEIYPVHRLDREAGGVMVYAKNQRTAATLSAAIQRREWEKGYLCLTCGIPAQPEGTAPSAPGEPSEVSGEPPADEDLPVPEKPVIPGSR